MHNQPPAVNKLVARVKEKKTRARVMTAYRTRGVVESEAYSFNSSRATVIGDTLMGLLNIFTLQLKTPPARAHNAQL